MIAFEVSNDRAWQIRQCGFAAILCGLLALTGCGSSSTPPPSTGPLTVEEWRDMEPSEKYDPATFDRLKLSDTKLQTDAGWDQFMRDVVVPDRKLDIPKPEPADAENS